MSVHLAGTCVILCGLPFCRDMFCAGRVPEEDLKRTMKACGGSIQTTVQSLTPDVLGTCELFEEVQLGGERCVITVTFVVCVWGHFVLCLCLLCKVCHCCDLCCLCVGILCVVFVLAV